jgi:hypothetical protein
MNEEQLKFAAEVNVAVLATVDGKGRPHATPIWYMLDGDEIVLSVGDGGQKHRNLERNPEVTLVIDSRKVPYYAIMVAGRMEIGPPPNDEERLALATRYLGEEVGKRYVEMTAANDSVSLRLKARKVMEFNGRAGG